MSQEDWSVAVRAGWERGKAEGRREALESLDFALGQLRHAYPQIVAVKGEGFAKGLIAPAIESIERLRALAEQKAESSSCRMSTRKMMSAEHLDYDTLDPGVRDVVRRLVECGFITTDSGDGVTKPAEQRTMDTPHVMCVTAAETLITAADYMQTVLGDDWTIQASYDPKDGSAVLVAMLEVCREEN